MGKLFLSQFLSHLQQADYDGFSGNKKTVEKATEDFARIEGWETKVEREFRINGKSADLVIFCKNSFDEKKNFIVLIENKFLSGEHDNQLENYRTGLLKSYPAFKLISVYLTRTEDDKNPSDTHYFHITYETVLSILETALQKNLSSSSDKNAVKFISYYTEILKENLDMDDEKAQLAKKIYEKYGDAIDYIYDHAQIESDIKSAGDDFIKKFNDKNKNFQLEYLSNNRHFYYFADNILSGTNSGTNDDWHNGKICGYFFEITANKGGNGGKLLFHIEVGTFSKSENRNAFLSLLEDDFYFKADENSKYTRLSDKEKKIAKSKNLKDISDADEISRKMSELFEIWLPKILALHKSVQEFCGQ